jgi:hypothetical protein
MGVMRIAARRVLSVGFVLALAVGVSVLGGASASAEVVHNFEFSFNGSGTPAGSFAPLGTIAVDQVSGDVYVVDPNHEVVDRFDAAGKYLGQITGAAVPQGFLGLNGPESGVAVDGSGGPDKGDLYVAGAGVVYRFDSLGKLLGEVNGSGTPAGSFAPTGVTVDAAGNLYVADQTNRVVDEFNAAGGYVGQIASAQITYPRTIAVDAGGNVYLTNFEQSVVKLEPGGGSSVLDANKALAVAVDPATGHVYVSESYYPAPGRIVEFDQSGTQLSVFGEEQVSSNVLGLAVHGATGEVYAADYGKHLVDVFGPDLVIPDTTTDAASNVQPGSVMFNGTVNPDGVPVSSCQFEYGTSASYGQTVACEQSPGSIGSGTSPVPVSANVSGLARDMTYHFRLVASSTNGAKQGSDITVTTAGAPLVGSESASGVTRTGAALEAQIDPLGFDTTYHFEYGTSVSYGTSVPVPGGDIGSGFSGVPVSQSIGGLQSGVTYHYRVVAANAQGTTDGSDQTFTTVPPAYIDVEYATNVASTSATLGAQVNPIGTASEFRFEYGTSVSYGQAVTGSTGEVTGDVLASRHLQELQPGTTYHYRIAVQNAFGTAEGADHTFTTEPVGSGLTLPDGRAWELVSPPDKKGALIEPYDEAQGEVQAASGGDGIVYVSVGPSVGENPHGHAPFTQTLAMRDRAGWASQDLSVPSPEKFANIESTPEYSLFSPDLSLALVQPQTVDTTPLSPEVPEGERSLYVRNDLNGSFTALVTPSNVLPGTSFGGGENAYHQMHFLTATPDLNHVAFGSELALTAGAANGTGTNGHYEQWNLYEWGEGRLALVNILPDGKLAFLPEGTQSNENAMLADQVINEAFPGGGGERVISDDGRRIAWTWVTPYNGGFQTPSYRGLYVRDMVEGRTVRVGGQTAVFQSMNSDGSRVFYLEGGELYEYNWGTGASTDLTAGHGPGDSSAGVQEPPLGVSEDGSYVYFVADGVLSRTANANGETATPGGCVFGREGVTCNLYVVHYSGGAWEAPRFIATLSSADEASWYEHGTKGAPELGQMSSRVSPNGRFVAFMSERSLTGYDNIDTYSGQPDEEVYVYDALTGRLACASCDPTGARPVGVHDTEQPGPRRLLVDPHDTWASFNNPAAGSHWLAGSIPSWDKPSNAAVYQPRYLSDSGRLFFDSPDALVPQDINGLEDAYEYEPAGVGGCTSASATFSERSGGCVNLISSGTSSSESAFMDASENGNDAFFLTNSRLTSQDYDTAYDVYDAHVCSTAVPCPPVAVSPPPCTSGDSCKAAPSPQPEIFGAAPSATFNGTGNVSVSPAGPVVKPRSLSRAQKLARALRACQRKKGKRRTVCERQARKRYGAKQSRKANATVKGHR